MSSLENPILDALEPRTRTRLLERSVPRRLAKGEFLYLAGDREPRVHVVVEGLLKFVGRDGSGVETTVGLAVSGDTAGEIAALDDLPQPLDAVAVVPTVVRGFAADAFMSAVTSDPDATAVFHTQMAARLRWAYAMTQERSTSEVGARLAGRLLDLADILGRVSGGVVEFEMPMAQADLGQLAGMCRESTCKTLRSFKRDGIVDYRNRRLRILRPDVLERIRCAGRA